MIDELYSARILKLAANLPHSGRLAAPEGTGERVAKLCGSKAIVDVTLDEAGRVLAFAQDVKACALGQAAATLLARHAPGRDLTELRAARDAIAAWFGGSDSTPPEWPGFDLLAPARDYPARHGAILLPFDAAIQALQGQVVGA